MLGWYSVEPDQLPGTEASELMLVRWVLHPLGVGGFSGSQGSGTEKSTKRNGTAPSVGRLVLGVRTPA